MLPSPNHMSTLYCIPEETSLMLPQLSKSEMGAVMVAALLSVKYSVL